MYIDPQALDVAYQAFLLALRIAGTMTLVGLVLLIVLLMERK